MTDSVYKFYVGIDVSKEKVDVAISDHPTVLRFSNNQEGLNELVKVLRSKKRTLIVLEATGGYEKFVANGLKQKKFNVAVVNARRVRDFAKAGGVLVKTDCVDAKVIMRYGKAFNPVPQKLKPSNQTKLEEAVNRRTQIVKLIAMEKQHLEHASDLIKKDILKHISYLEKTLSALDNSILGQVAQDAELKDKVTRLDGIKGVGEVTAINVLVHMPELGSLTSKEVSALAGVAPFNKDSGQSKGKRKTWGGRSQARTALYMAVLAAKKFNPAIKKFYDRLISRGKLKMVAIVACMRKLIIMMNAMIRDQTEWDPKLL